jgi:hypothetical protein
MAADRWPEVYCQHADKQIEIAAYPPELGCYHRVRCYGWLLLNDNVAPQLTLLSGKYVINSTIENYMGKV